MTRSLPFSALRRISRIASSCKTHDLSTRDALEEIARVEAVEAGRGLTRRQALGAIGAAAITLGVGPAAARPVRTNARIAIVGAGLAGLACADRLERSGRRPSAPQRHPRRQPFRRGGRRRA